MLSDSASEVDSVHMPFHTTVIAAINQACALDPKRPSAYGQDVSASPRSQIQLAEVRLMIGDFESSSGAQPPAHRRVSRQSQLVSVAQGASTRASLSFSWQRSPPLKVANSSPKTPRTLLTCGSSPRRCRRCRPRRQRELADRIAHLREGLCEILCDRTHRRKERCRRVGHDEAALPRSAQRVLDALSKVSSSSLDLLHRTSVRCSPWRELAAEAAWSATTSETTPETAPSAPAPRCSGVTDRCTPLHPRSRRPPCHRLPADAPHPLDPHLDGATHRPDGVTIDVRRLDGASRAQSHDRRLLCVSSSAADAALAVWHRRRRHRHRSPVHLAHQPHGPYPLWQHALAQPQSAAPLVEHQVGLVVHCLERCARCRLERLPSGHDLGRCIVQHLEVGSSLAMPSANLVATEAIGGGAIGGAYAAASSRRSTARLGVEPSR